MTSLHVTSHLALCLCLVFHYRIYTRVCDSVVHFSSLLGSQELRSSGTFQLVNRYTTWRCEFEDTKYKKMPYNFKKSDIPKLDLETDRNNFTSWIEEWTAYAALSGLNEENAITQYNVTAVSFISRNSKYCRKLGPNGGRQTKSS